MKEGARRSKGGSQIELSRRRVKMAVDLGLALYGLQEKERTYGPDVFCDEPKSREQLLAPAIEILRSTKPNVDERGQYVFAIDVEHVAWRLRKDKAQFCVTADKIMAIEKLSKLLSAIRALAQTWDQVLGDRTQRGEIARALPSSVLYPHGPIARKPAEPFRDALYEMMDQASWMERAHTFVHLDFASLANAIEELLGILRGRRSAPLTPFVYLAVWSLAVAWYSATSILPTFSNDKAACAGPQASAFESLVFIVLPELRPANPSKAVRVVRDVATAFRLDVEGRRTEHEGA
jgi:hypothetical protein